MVGVAIVLFTLDAYDSPALAGLVTLAYILPGILVSPIAGALLDRHGRVRLIILDYIVAGSTLGIIAFLALLGPPARGTPGPHRRAGLADLDPERDRAAQPVPDHGPEAPLGAGQRRRLEWVHRGDDPRPTDRRGPCDGCRRAADAGDHRRDDAAGHGPADRRP